VERIWAPPALPVAAALAVFGTRFGLDYARERHLRHAVSEAFPAISRRISWRSLHAIRVR
jgi:hypothetical protein